MEKTIRISGFHKMGLEERLEIRSVLFGTERGRSQDPDQGGGAQFRHGQPDD